MFTNLYDGLDRIKVAAGPAVVTVVPGIGPFPTMTNLVQQIANYSYDSSGKVLIVSNAVGEQTVTTRDALGRVVSVQIFSSNSPTPLRVTTTSYSADHNSSTVWEGTGSTAIPTVYLTDTMGNNVLTLRYPNYPSLNNTEFSLQVYDANGNRLQQNQCSWTTNVVTVWSTNSWTYDGLNRITTEISRDGATTSYYRDALGDVTNRIVPGGVQCEAAYNAAGQLIQEWNLGSGNAGMRTNSYTYYAAGTMFGGLAHTRTDGLGVTCTYLYDDLLRNATNSYTGVVPGNTLTSFRLYDARGLVTRVVEYTDIDTFTEIDRTYDAYGNAISENDPFYSIAQGMDSAGRRSFLSFGSFSYKYTWRADGLLASVTTPVGSGNYTYNDSGLLVTDAAGSRLCSITSRDGIGRPLSITNTVNMAAKLGEGLTWTPDGLLNTHSVQRNDSGQFTDSRSYFYANSSRRLTEERLNLDGSTRWTNIFAYDAGTTGGPGALTKAGAQASNSATWTGAADGFSRIGNETNTVSRLGAYGRINGQAAVTALLDGEPMPVVVAPTGNHDWGYQWRTTLELNPGAHQLALSAQHPSGLFVTNASSWFTNNISNQTVADTFDALGQLTSRVWRNPNGSTNRTQNLLWDFKGRLWQVSETDVQGNGYNWYAEYDGLDRRIDSWFLVNSNGIPEQRGPRISFQYFDPAVEFLELGVSVDSRNLWKVYGPDLDGRYGGQNGTGGLEAVAEETGSFSPTLKDARGNVLGIVTNASIAWSPSRPTGYGAVPGYRPLALGSGATLAQASSWRGRWPDITGYVWLGARYYNPESGAFLSSDPLWNERDPNYYSYCGGDPINLWDPDGRLGRNWLETSRSYEGNVHSVGDFFSAVGYGLGGIALTLPSEISSAFGQAQQSMAAANQEISTYSGGQAFLANTLRLPANFAFGTTTFVNDPVETVPQIPRGVFVDFPTSVAQNIQNFANDPSIYGAFNLVENGLQAAALVEGGVNLYKGGLDFVQTRTGPAGQARAWQGQGSYPGVDDWRNVTLQAGDIVYAGAPGESPFFTTGQAVATSGGQSATLFQSLQVAPHPTLGYRPGVTLYLVTDETPAATASTTANPQFGPGGAQQFFIPDRGNLQPVLSIPLRKK